MFVLSEKNLGVKLEDINKIVITFFSLKSEILNIYDTNFKFDENIIPLITSLFEISPIIYNYKLYKCIDTNIIINQYQQLTNNNRYNNDMNFQHKFPSFQYDIEIFNNKYIENIKNIKSTLINTIIDNDEKHIIRMYYTENINIDKNKNMGNSNTNNTNNSIYNNTKNNTTNYNEFNDFTQNILSETEYTIILWMFEWGSFEMLIKLNNKNNDNNNVIYQLNINTIEDNTFIESRLNAINNIITKIHKLKVYF